jgi:hypothetical protein
MAGMGDKRHQPSRTTPASAAVLHIAATDVVALAASGVIAARTAAGEPVSLKANA